MRIKIIRLIIIGLFLMIALELMYVQVIRGPFYFRLSKNNRIRVVPLEGWRGKIKDRQGEILADNVLSFDAVVIPQDTVFKQELFTFVGQVLKIDQKKIAQNYALRKFAPFAPVVIAQDITREQAIVIEENRYRFPSLFIQESTKRVYPLKENAAHVLGYVGKMNTSQLERHKKYGYSAETVVGTTGVEEYYDQYLKGSEGGKQIEVNSRGQQVRLLGLKEPASGKDLTLTLDARLQKDIQELFQGRRGAMVVLDVRNGEVLGLSSSPSFDPQTRTSNSDDSPFLNRAIRGSFPPGSVFKIPVALAGLNTRKINPQSTFVCPGYYELGGTRFGCTHTHGPQNLIEAVAHSCNVYFYNLGRMLGPDALNHYAGWLGLGHKTGIDLPYEDAGYIPSRIGKFLKRKLKWFGGDTLNFAIGQGDVLATPLQLANMMAMIANDGMVLEPHLIKSIGLNEVAGFSIAKRAAFNQEDLTVIQRALRSTVTDTSGTGHLLVEFPFYIAGKTGTAQSSPNKEHHAWFAGYAESDKRLISFCVFIEYGGSSHHAVEMTKELLLKMREYHLI